MHRHGISETSYITLTQKEDMLSDMAAWHADAKISTFDFDSKVKFQAKYVLDLLRETD